MDTQSSSAAASRSAAAASRSGGGHPPLIKCPDCHLHTVVRCRSKQEWSKDEVFYTCPDHKKDGTGCPFFRWEAGYIKYLEKKSTKGKEKQADGVTESLLEKQLDMESRDASGSSRP